MLTKEFIKIVIRLAKSSGLLIISINIDELLSGYA